MISQTAEYALRAVVCLAAEPDRSLTTPEIARRGRIPAGYLAKIMGALARAGVVRGRRGVGGGYTLIPPAAGLRVLEVVEAVDPIRRIEHCPLDLTRHRGGLCPLHRRLDEAARALAGSLAAVKIAALLDAPPEQRPLCLPARARRGPADGGANFTRRGVASPRSKRSGRDGAGSSPPR